MNNKAFTLIELTAVVLLLAIIFFVSFPSLLSLSKSDEERKYTTMIDNLCMAGETYIYSNMEKFNDLIEPDNTIEINISLLIDNGLVESSQENPRTKEKVLNHKLIYTVNTDNSLKCQYVEEE